MSWVSVKFELRFDTTNPVFGLPEFRDQITPGNPIFKLPIIQQYVPELDSLVWDADPTKLLFVGILGFNTDNYAAANLDWLNPDGTWNFTPQAPLNGVMTPRATWTIIRMLTDRIFCVPAQTRNGWLWTPVTGRYRLFATEVSAFPIGGGIGGGGWGGMQHNP